MKFVQIHSTITITVTPGLQYANNTRKDSDIPDRLKVSPQWVESAVKILEGQHEYPEIVATYPTVKALEKDGILTIGAIIDKENNTSKQLEEKIKKMNNNSTKESTNNVKIKGVNLEKLAKEE